MWTGYVSLFLLIVPFDDNHTLIPACALVCSLGEVFLKVLNVKVPSRTI